MNFIKNLWNKQPLLLILVVGLILRLVSVAFAKGFGMHDDHFLVIEAAQSWADGSDYNNWLPGSKVNAQPTGHSMFYVGLHYFLFTFLNFIHLDNPQAKMFVVRLLHALLSMFVIYFGYKITEKLSNKTIAKNTALLLAVLWIMPWLSVRNLVEVVCIPFLITGIWMILNYESKKNEVSYLILSGIVLGFGMNIRYQTSIFIFGIILSLLIEKKWRKTIFVSFGIALSFMVIQGFTDYYIWKKPFAEFIEYVKYNIASKDIYVTNSWYTYILLLLGIFIPPISIFLLIGFFSSLKKKYLILFIPSLLFLVFHSMFPNKQERFIIPMIPFYIILGMIGWNAIINKSNYLQRHTKAIYYSWIFFWIINILMLPVISTMYSKRARVESMTYLSKYQNIKMLLLEDSNHESAKMPPEFYLGQWISVWEVNKTKNIDTLRYYMKISAEIYHPKHVLFFEDKNLARRIKGIKEVFPKLKFEKVIEPGLVDNILYILNPINANQTIYIFRTY